MNKRPVAALILAAGLGTRMKSDVPKVLHEISGNSILDHVLNAVRAAGIRHIGVVVGNEWKEKGSLQKNVETVLQKDRLGTAHAVMQAKKKFKSWRGDLLVLPGDTPCLRSETLKAVIEAHQKEDGTAATVLTAYVSNPYGYGRIIRTGGDVQEIREELDASDEERAINEVNSGVYVFETAALFEALDRVAENQLKKEYYLTDVVKILCGRGRRVAAYAISSEAEILGVNNRVQLGQASEILNAREIAKHQLAGVTVVVPSQTYISNGVKIGRDTVIRPFTWIDRDVIIGSGCEIGPFAKIRSGSKIGDGAIIGSFVEVVRSKVGKQTFIKHLSYIGDAQVGDRVNVGAGTVVANFDGIRKNKTIVKDGAFLGCNTVLIAPSKVGTKAKTGAGAVVVAHHSVPDGSTVVGVPAKVMSHKKKG